MTFAEKALIGAAVAVIVIFLIAWLLEAHRV